MNNFNFSNNGLNKRPQKCNCNKLIIFRCFKVCVERPVRPCRNWGNQGCNGFDSYSQYQGNNNYESSGNEWGYNMGQSENFGGYSEGCQRFYPTNSLCED